MTRYLVRTLAAVSALVSVVGAELLPVKYSFNAHGDIPPFSVRLGKDTASVCNSPTPGTAGFIDSDDGNDTRMFFWLFESKNDPTTDPVVLWMSGGPGASSTGAGNLMELGPCRISQDGSHTVDNPYGWNTNATVLFVDQPAKVGFSQARTIPSGLPEATKLMHRFLRQFFIAFPQLSDLDFFIAGESMRHLALAWQSSLA
ncbi:hypothetical protein NM208_g16767 [Fusarium decemcellulare]|uniref:Uncharacterized protein n=1 Tax=Fusarium decemcellulare TaxID=57161 RepID=A0ACC1RAH4_9HYPO|nr:hypothetical protein NM208_g16767 [Fusarium decemcellulare]